MRLSLGPSVGLLAYVCADREGVTMSSTYSEDEFELTAGSLSVVSSDTGPNTRESHEEEEEEGGGDQQGADEREGASPKLAVVLPKEGVDADDNAGVSEAGYSSFEDDEVSLPLISPSFTVGERDGRTTKQVCVHVLLAGVNPIFCLVHLCM